MIENFDYALYQKRINEIVSTLDNLAAPNIIENMRDKTIPILNMFHITLLTSDYVEYTGKHGISIDEGGFPPTLELGLANMDVSVVLTKEVSNMVFVKLNAYPSVSAPSWDDETKEQIRAFMNLYFNLIARVRILRMFEKRIFHDVGMPFVGNLSCLMRDLSRFQKMGRLDEFTIFRINIFNFSKFNRIFGRPAGDKIINQYILKLVSFCDGDGDIYRLGGDNFLGLVPNRVVPDIQKFFEGYTMKFNEDSPEIEIQSRAGFYQIGDNGLLIDTIMNRANSTFAKTNGKHKIRFFDLNEEKTEFKNVQIESEFMQALKNKKVVAFYQPKVDVQTNRIASAEALCRWVKDGEIIQPPLFIPILERNNQICTLDFYMLRKICEDMKAWIQEGNTLVPISVNFSRNNLADKNFVSKILDTIDEYQIPHEYITIELTETTLEVDFEGITSVVNELRSHNLKTAVDDFGMGYSSINLIKDIKWDVLKIDKSFVPNKDSANYDKYRVLLNSVIQMANDTGMLSVVEGVETQEQLDLVKEYGCKVVQGYFFDKPLSKEEFESKLKGTFQGECKWAP